MDFVRRFALISLLSASPSQPLSAPGGEAIGSFVSRWISVERCGAGLYSKYGGGGKFYVSARECVAGSSGDSVSFSGCGGGTKLRSSECKGTKSKEVTSNECDTAGSNLRAACTTDLLSSVAVYSYDTTDCSDSGHLVADVLENQCFFTKGTGSSAFPSGSYIWNCAGGKVRCTFACFIGLHPALLDYTHILWQRPGMHWESG
jgi:hypothetical protein